MRVFLWFALAIGTASAEVKLLRTPDGGLQPQAVVDDAGRIHLVYFKGPPRGGDLFYVHKSANASEFSSPLQINSKSGNAIAVGTIRGAQIALGKSGRIHVAWNSADGKEMLYTRINDGAFEPARNVMAWTGGLDGGGSVAADNKGNVYVTWHGSAPENKKGEAGRAVFAAISPDEGRTFAKELQINPSSGACGCCGMKALAVSNHVYALYRAARNQTGRDMVLLLSAGQEFTARTVSKWNLASCPMSSATFADGPNGMMAGWEMERQVAFSGVFDLDFVTPTGTGKRKHPSLAQNASGTILMAWVEDSGWEKGGTLAWQLFKGKKPLGEVQRGEAIPVWSMPAAIAFGEQFLIIY